jgi:hypothetical protein
MREQAIACPSYDFSLSLFPLSSVCLSVGLSVSLFCRLPSSRPRSRSLVLARSRCVAVSFSLSLSLSLSYIPMLMRATCQPQHGGHQLFPIASAGRVRRGWSLPTKCRTEGMECDGAQDRCLTKRSQTPHQTADTMKKVIMNTSMHHEAIV